LPQRRTRLRAAVSALLAVATILSARPVQAAPHGTVSLQAQFVGFYPGHLILDGIGSAFLDDGVLHVHADRIILDLRANRYVAAGSVTVEGASVAHGDALGVDLVTHRGVLIDTTSAITSEAIDGKLIGGPAAIAPGDEPLALPDVGFEHPYARAARVVAHLGADVRLSNAHIIVPGGESVGLPSYVYTFSSSPGYSQTNITTNGEDLPIYFGSTANSIQGAHFSYNTISKVAIGLDSHFVDSSKAYVLVSGSPIIGHTKTFNFTWQEHINDKVSQTFDSSTTTGIGTFNHYDLVDAIHRSSLDLSASQGLGAHSATFSWQSFNQSFGSATAASRPYYFLRSEYGYVHVPQQGSFAPFPPDVELSTTVWHTGFEGYLASQSWNFGRNSSLYGSADLKDETDTLPHRGFAQTYTLTLDTLWNRNVSTSFSDSANPFFDDYTSVNTIYHSRLNFQTLTLRYDHGDPFAINLSATHTSAFTDNPSPLAVTPWSLFGDVRFRVTPSLSLDISRTYFFGFNGERFGALGLQILP
jgi:hypothetical protein